MKYYASTHEWVEIENGIATVGISNHAADEMGDLSYVEMPEIGKTYKAGEAFGSVESLKAASEIFAPVTGTVCEINDILNDTPEKLNEAPECDGWICKLNNVEQNDLQNLMTLEQYLESVK